MAPKTILLISQMPRQFHSWSYVPNIHHNQTQIPKQTYELPLKFRSDHLSHYELLGISRLASPREIKRRFKQLSKMYHPDIVHSNPQYTDLSEQEKKLNSENYIKLVASYEVLSDSKRRQNYDLTLDSSGVGEGGSRSNFYDHTSGTSNTHNERSKYYGEAKYYSRANGHYSPSGLNFSRGHVHYGHNYDPNVKSYFHGMPNSNSKHDVPHFDFDKHLQMQLKMEERLMNKKLKQMGSVFGEGAENLVNTDRRFHNIYRHHKKKQHE